MHAIFTYMPIPVNAHSGNNSTKECFMAITTQRFALACTAANPASY